ncbi:aspartic peptidase domain-containing protein [Lasiosphaeria hispida]|uniref:Aspartic peptidase domain-containing protein n=1 Tax=Lasiosphaeria hispida TaxID=260671 RepID=A0AAJ0HG80_9PEZI|nr:aspartic peptidase domain-containing protein [Lasiosphaeria hispida]
MARHDVPGAHDLPLRRRGNVNVTQSLVNVHDVYYIIELLVGGQKIPVSVDTGSSDTWLVQQPYECVQFFFQPGQKPNCGLGDGFKGNLSGGRVPKVEFGRSYADGTFVRGFFGFEDVTIGGLTSKLQRIALVNYTYWFGDGKTSGLLGLAYPYMTSLDGPNEDQPLYDPVFTSLWKDKQILPLFSMALSRYADQSAGQKGSDEGHENSYLALGGLPPVSYDEASWARTPIQSMSVLTDWGLDTQERGLYVITPDAYVFGKTNTSVPLSEAGLATNTTHIPVLQLYAQFDPPAEYLSSNGMFFAKCDAKVPAFGIKLGGTTFWMAPDDLLKQNARDPTGKWCRVGVYDSDASPHVLGVSFLANVVAVFDVEHHEMRFAKRTKY